MTDTIVTEQPTVETTAQPVATQAPAPIVEPTQQPQAQQPATQPTNNTPVDYTGGTPLETAVNIFAGSTGITHDVFAASIQNALQYGDPNLIDVATLTQGLKPEQAAQAKALATAVYQQVQSDRNNAVQTAYSKAGGEAQWNTTIEAFNSQAPQWAKDAAKALEQAGNVGAAVDFIINQAQQFGITNSQQGEFIQPSGAQPNSTAALGSAEFKRAIGELQIKAGNELNNPRSPYYAELELLQQRRQLGKRQGLQ